MAKKNLIIILILSIATSAAGFLADGDPGNPGAAVLISEFAFMTILCFGLFTLMQPAAAFAWDLARRIHG